VTKNSRKPVTRRRAEPVSLTRARKATRPRRPRAAEPKAAPARRAPTPPRAAEAVVETVVAPAESAPARAAVETAPAPAAVETAPEAAEPRTEADLALPLATPETEFAGRVAPVEAERPFPAGRRVIFFDVENTSRPEHIARVIDHLAVDRLGKRTEFIAVGNWKVIGPETARLLSHHGAQLVHSAPAAGVRDWSDLRIAVSAGVWLAGARPGDIVEIVSNDRAFDAVGDVAAGLGIAFRRLTYQVLAGLPATPAPAAVDGKTDGRLTRRRRGRRRGRGPAPHAVPHARASLEPRREEPVRRSEHRRPEPAARPAAARPVEHHRERPRPVDHLAPDALTVTAASGNGAEPDSAQTAPHDEIVSIIRDLIQHTPSRRVSIDSLANTLKARGFRRTPGSPRLITRLRRIKQVDVSPAGIITLSPEYEAHDAEPGPVEAAPEERPVVVDLPRPAPPADEDEDDRQPDVTPTGEPIAAGKAAAARRRRGGRGRRSRTASRTKAAAS
jgi:hypothetical protein